MALELIHTGPQAEAFVPLSEHQSQTPGTFFGGKPVLYYHGSNAVLEIDTQQLEASAAFSSLRAGRDGRNGVAANGDADGNHQPLTQITGLDVWVTSEYFIIFSPTLSSGVQIPYPTISLHAQQSHALYMQLCLSDIRQTADDDLETLELFITPCAPTPATVDGVEERPEDQRAESSSQALYAAVSACADLHPDPDEDDEGGFAGEQDQAPGAGGWITSENMNDFMDDDGNFRMPESAALGAGAGTVRTADDAQFEDAAEGENPEAEDGKWRRTG